MSPPPAWLYRLGDYGLALLFVAAAALVRWALAEVLNPVPGLVFYLAWVGAAAFGGLGPGLLAMLASWWCIGVLFNFPPWQVSLGEPASLARIVIFLAGGLVVSVVGETMRRSRIYARRQGRELADANVALRASEGKYRFLIENSKDITGTIDLRGQCMFVSANVEKMIGYRADELLGKPLWDFLAPECHDLVRENLRRRLGGEDVPPYELLVVGQDGRRIPFEVVMALVVGDGGNIVGVQGVFRDITERKRAQEALAESRKKYRRLVEKVNDWVWEIDADGVYTYSSPRALDLLGYAPEEIVGRTPFDLMPPAEAQRVWDAFQPIWLERKPLEQLENTLVRKDGRLVTVETSGMPVFAEDGSFLGYTGVDRDVTERKWAEEQLRRSEQDLNRAQAVAQTGSWRLDVRHNELLWSHETHRIFGIPDGTPMTYETFLAAVHPADREYVDRQWTAALHGELCDIEFRIVVDGQLKWVRARAELEFDEAGTLRGGFGTVQDITERKRAEEALRSSQSMLQSVMGNVPQGIFWKDRHSTYLGCNNVFAQAVGLESAGDIIGKTDYDLPWSPEQTASFRTYDRRIMDSDAPEYHIIEQMREISGRLAWVETNKVPLHDAQGHVMGILGTYEDITERKQAEQALRESEEKFRLLAETSPAAILIYQDGKYVYANPAAESLTGYRCAELLAQAPGDIVHPDYRQQVQQMASRRARGEGRPMHYELKILAKDGQERWMDSATVSIMYGNKPAGLVVAFDVTERKRAEKALQKSEEKFAKAFRSSPIAIAVTRLSDGCILDANEAMLKLLHFTAEEVIGHTTRDLDIWVEVNDRAQFTQMLAAAGSVRDLEYRLRTKDGVIVTIHLSAELLEFSGEPCILSTLVDVTERQRAAEALREWNATLKSRVAERTEELEQRAGQLQKLALELTEAEERERKRLAEILHDDLQQVLAAAKFQVGLLSTRVRNDAEAQEAAGQAKDLLADAIAKSRSLSHELSAPTLSQSDLCETFEWLAEQMQKKHGFTVHLDLSEPIELASEPLRALLYKAARESLFNVIKHAGVREAKLRLRHRRGRLRLSVSDQGRGFDPREPGPNLGFGLLSIRERVESLGGRMKIRSAVGKGSIFVITVPDAEVHEGQ